MREALVVLLTMMWAAPVAAQSVLAAARINTEQVPPEATLVLRPAGDSSAFAERIAHVLELRSGRATQVGEPPPAGMLEAVPAGQVGLESEPGAVRIVVIGADGRVVTARVVLDAGGGASDARAVALVVEALQDEARRPTPVPVPADLETESEVAPVTSPPSSSRESAHFTDLRDTGTPRIPGPPNFLGDIEPLLFVRAFTGISSSSTHPMTGVGAGLGLCSEGNCALITAEYPISSASDQATPDEVRYRYLTFASGFYARPFTFGTFTPGAGVAFVTRVGSVEGPSDLDTDLGARGTLELAWRPMEGFDIIAEGGLDVALDQARSRSGYAVTYRGDRWTPWLQAALRFCPELD